MGMTIDEIIQGIQIIKAQAEWDYPLDWQIVLDGATDIMRKYQKIEDVVTDFNNQYNHRTALDLMCEVKEVVEK